MDKTISIIVILGYVSSVVLGLLIILETKTGLSDTGTSIHCIKPRNPDEQTTSTQNNITVRLPNVGKIMSTK